MEEEDLEIKIESKNIKSKINIEINKSKHSHIFETLLFEF